MKKKFDFSAEMSEVESIKTTPKNEYLEEEKRPLDVNAKELASRKHSKKCTFYTLRFGCSFAAVNTIKPQLL